jgi:dihydrolipoamide dehydrogenase
VAWSSAWKTARVDFDKRGIKVDDRCATNQPGVFAIGDCTGRAWLAHTASRMGEVVVNNLTGRADRMRWNAIPGVVYTTPEVATVGPDRGRGPEAGICRSSRQAPHGHQRPLPGRDTPMSAARSRWSSTRRRAVLLGVHLIGGACSEMIFGAAAMIEAEFRVKEWKRSCSRIRP